MLRLGALVITTSGECSVNNRSCFAYPTSALPIPLGPPSPDGFWHPGQRRGA